MNAIQKLKKEAKDIQEKLVAIQDACNHPKLCVTSEYWRATCEYGTETTAEGYRNECSLCEKTWSSDKDMSQ